MCNTKNICSRPEYLVLAKMSVECLPAVTSMSSTDFCTPFFFFVFCSCSPSLAIRFLFIRQHRCVVWWRWCAYSQWYNPFFVLLFLSSFMPDHSWQKLYGIVCRMCVVWSSLCALSLYYVYVSYRYMYAMYSCMPDFIVYFKYEFCALFKAEEPFSHESLICCSWKIQFLF